MNLVFNDINMRRLQDVINNLDQLDMLFMNHYELSEATGIPADEWKAFLLDPKVSQYMAQELTLYKEHQLKQMIRNATDNDKSVGAAQMINSLTKSLQDSVMKDGPIIIYTHVPLTDSMRLGTTIETIELEENVLADLPQEWED